MGLEQIRQKREALLQQAEEAVKTLTEHDAACNAKHAELKSLAEGMTTRVDHRLIGEGDARWEVLVATHELISARLLRLEETVMVLSKNSSNALDFVAEMLKLVMEEP